MPRAFRLIETLGEGSFGAVHLAEVAGGEGFVQRLAVKWLLPQWSHDNELVGRLRDEARLLGLLNHDHVVRVHGLTRIDGRLAILMEAVDGVDLSRVTQAVPPRAAVQIVESVADALDAAWQTVPPGGSEPLRVVHRDIKPSNIMVTARGGVKVMDFGVARATFDAREARTRSQQFGTARYMAPERWLQGVADAPSDVFSLGVTLIELVAGAPFERPRLAEDGFREDLAAALKALSPWPEIEELAARMCAFRPEDRPTARGVADRVAALAPVLSGPDLREWAPGYVAARPVRRGAADGSVVHEDTNETFVSGRTEPFQPLGLDPTGSAPVGKATPTMPMPVLAPPPSGDRALAGPITGDNRTPTVTQDVDAPRWRQAMVVVAIVALTVLSLSAWQTWRASTRENVAVAATPPVPAATTPAEAPSSAGAADPSASTEASTTADPSPGTNPGTNPETSTSPGTNPSTSTSPGPNTNTNTSTSTNTSTTTNTNTETSPGTTSPNDRPVLVDPLGPPPIDPAHRDDPVVADPTDVADAGDDVIVQFQFDPELEVTANGGTVTRMRGMTFRKGSVINVLVQGPDIERFPCTITADPGGSVVHIDKRKHTCN